ncbi:hypothetical protein V8G54_010005, partial [Vigna mungo]
IDFPRGHIEVKSFDVEVVDEVGNSVPLYKTYLHHWFAVKYIENITMSHYIKQSHDLRNGIEFERNDGACQGFLLPHYWGLGGESRGTHSNLPDPFAVELDNVQCKLRNGFRGPTRKFSLRYKIRWVDWDEHQVPLKFYILDSTDRVRSNGSTPIHDCQDGRVLCTSNPKYGTGKEAGNEKGYLVGMSVCYPKPGSIKIADGEILTLESIYENKFCTGAMGHFYIYLAEQIPNKYLKEI